MTKSSVLKVTGPQAYFVELTVYSEVTGETPEKIQYQELGGATKPCVPDLNGLSFFLLAR